MFHKINNKYRFAIENTELNLKLFNAFFYKNEDIKLFDIVHKKTRLDPEDEFYKNHVFQKKGYRAPNLKINFKNFFFYSVKKSKKIQFKNILKTIVFKNAFESPTNIHNEFIYNFHYYYFNLNRDIYNNQKTVSQSLNFFFVKKLHQREFFKQKVQMKNHTFNKTIINVDIFNKKRTKVEFSFIQNSNKLHNSLEKLNNLLVFNAKNERTFFKTFVFKTKFSWILNKLRTDTQFLWKIETDLLRFKKIKVNSLFLLKKTNLKNKFNINFNSSLNIKNIYTYNLTKLLLHRNNYLTNEVTNMTLFSNFKNFLNEDKKNTLNYLPKFENKFIMNNFLPYYNFFVKSKFYKSVLLRNILNPSFSLYYSFYLFNFLEVFLKKKIWLKINTKSNSVLKGKLAFFINDVFKKNKNDQYNVGRHFYLLEFLEILYITLYYRDLKFFSYWFKKTMEKLHLKKHRKLIKVIQNTLKNNPEFLNLLNVKGFTMDVRGKLGTTGNSKKKHYAFTVGTMSPTSKNHDMAMNQTTVRTNTGVLGVTITLSF